MYYFLTREDRKRKDRVDSLLARATADWNRARMNELQRAVKAAPVKSTVAALPSAPADAPPPKRERKLPTPPPGWGSEEDASRSSMLAAKMLQRGGR